MAVIKAVWNAVRGLALLVALSVLVAGVLAVSCLARLVLGAGGYAGRLHSGS